MRLPIKIKTTTRTVKKTRQTHICRVSGFCFFKLSSEKQKNLYIIFNSEVLITAQATFKQHLNSD